jgi:anthranilate synthase/aminodeoxychorismate synthase-like glutamine amidotransferase
MPGLTPKTSAHQPSSTPPPCSYHPSFMILVIDNYDSFTWNLVQRLWELDAALDVRVVRNDGITPDEARAMGPSHLIISPGPCTPREAGVSNDMIAALAGQIPMLGVCLGHQCIGHGHGMVVARHARIVHGKTSPIQHDAKGLFANLPNPFTATRYHSLVIPEDSVPKGGDWTVSAWTTDTFEDGSTARVVMGLRRNWSDASKAPLEGVQFHPESFLTDAGPALLANFLAIGQEATGAEPLSA